MEITAYRPSDELIRLVASLRGTWSGYRAMCHCPAHPDRRPSLSLRQGARGILIKCFAGCDTIDVLREFKRIADIRYAPAPDPCDQDIRQTANVRKIWSEGVDTSGTLAELYLASRQIDNRFDQLRFHPRCPKGRRPLTTFTPALLVAVQTAREVLAIQRVFLNTDASCVDKLMIGRPAAGAWRGSSADGNALAIAEGFETAARFSMITGIPCWASLGAARLPLLDIPPHISELIIAEDDDAEGAAAAVRAVAAYEAIGRRIVRRPPPRPRGFRGPLDWATVS